VYDILMLIVLAGCVLFGAWKGMAWQLASLASLVLSYLVALQFADALAPMIGTEEPWNRFVAMFILYIATSAGIWLAFRIVAGIIDRVKLREFDRQLGALFGGVKGVLLCMAITFFAVTLSSSAREVVLASKSGHYIGMLLHRVHPLIPEGVHEVLHPHFEEFERKLKPDGAPHDEHDHGEEPRYLPPEVETARGTQTTPSGNPFYTQPASYPGQGGYQGSEGTASQPGSLNDRFNQVLDGLETARRVSEAFQGNSPTTTTTTTNPPANNQMERLGDHLRWLGTVTGFSGIEALEPGEAPAPPNTSTR